jgi:alcohol dehydrogenase
VGDGLDGAVLRVEACGLCGTDHEQFTGLLPGPGPFVPGHESVGVIEAIGPAAADRWQVAVGDRVAVEVFLSCRACDACRAGEYRRCQQHGMLDMYGFVPVDREPGLWGGYATHQYLGRDSLVLPVPSSLDPVLATLFNPLGAGIRWGVTVPGTKAGDVVAILGPGIRGLSAVAACKEAGAGFVMVTGAGERDAERLALATRSPSSRRSRCRAGATPRTRSPVSCRASGAGRSTTSTRGSWRPSAAAPPSPSYRCTSGSGERSAG